MLRTSLLVLTLLLIASLAPAEVKLEIGPDTTVIDGPINPDGTINYLAYLNQKLSEGITPENNFAYDLVRTMGEDIWPSQEYQRKIEAWLQIEATDQRPVFRKFASYMEGLDVPEPSKPWAEQFHAASKEPWSSEHYPDLKRWLDDQAPALDLIARATAKDRSAFPNFGKDGGTQVVFDTMLINLAQVRQIGRTFAARAQLKIHNGDIEGAWSDVMVIHRTADLTMSEVPIISRLIGISIHSIALDVSKNILNSDALTSKQLRQAIKDSLSLPPCQGISDSMDIFDRFGILDALLRGRAGQLSNEILSDSTLEFLSHEQFDINFAMREINTRLDRLVKAARLTAPLERMDALWRLEQEVQHVVDQSRLMLKGNPEAMDSMRGEIERSNIYTTGGLYLMMGDTLPRPSSYVRSQVYAQMRLDLQPVAFAIAAYHADRDQYPPDLHALVPGYLDSLPLDFTTGELPVYRVEDGAAVVYSLGIDLEDDGGVDDPNEGDIVFRIDRR